MSTEKTMDERMLAEVKAANLTGEYVRLDGWDFRSKIVTDNELGYREILPELSSEKPVPVELKVTGRKVMPKFGTWCVRVRVTFLTSPVERNFVYGTSKVESGWLIVDWL